MGASPHAAPNNTQLQSAKAELAKIGQLLRASHQELELQRVEAQHKQDHQTQVFLELVATLTETQQATQAQAQEQATERERAAMQAEDLRSLCVDQQYYVRTCMQTQVARNLRERQVLRLFQECKDAKAAWQSKLAARLPNTPNSKIRRQLAEAQQEAQLAVASWHAAELSATRAKARYKSVLTALNDADT